MMQLQPNSITLKPKLNAYTAKDFPAKRVFNAYGYFELSGTALLNKAERDLLDQQWQWDSLEMLGLIGLGDYVARNKTQPKHSIVDCELYSSSFEFELKQSSADSAVQTLFFLDADSNLCYRPDLALALGVTFSFQGFDLVVSHPTIPPTDIKLIGDTVVRQDASAVAFVAGYAGFPPPLLDGFAENRVEFRTAQQFSSGRTRQISKRAGYLREVSFTQQLTQAEAARFVQFYRGYDHAPLSAPWLTDYFGQGRKLVLSQNPWELKVTGSHFDLAVQGFIV